MANLLDLSDKFYARIDRGISMPSVPTLHKMCLILQISADELLGRIPPSPPEVKPPPDRIARLLDTPQRRRLARKLIKASPRTLHLLDVLLTQVFQLLRGHGSSKSAVSTGEAKNTESVADAPLNIPEAT